MKFICEYRTRDNVLCSLEVKASSRDAAYGILKAQGIRPARLYDAPGLLNKIFGRGKRWILICVLMLVSISAIFFFLSLKNKVARDAMYENRGQLYGDPVLLSALAKENWASVFSDEGDRFLAVYAIPGKPVANHIPSQAVIPSLKNDLSRRVPVDERDHREVAQMKRMVNQMRQELEEYVLAGGTVEKYIKRLGMRQTVEQEIFRMAQKELSRELDEDVWRAKNESLRSKGLPMVAPDL